MKKAKFKKITVLLVSLVLLFTSCTGNMPTPDSLWNTFKTNTMNYDFPAYPNFALLSPAEMKKFATDMNNDTAATAGCDAVNAFIDDSGFYYVETYGETNIIINQDRDGTWWGSVPVNGELIVFNFTNVWPDNGFASLLPGKPNLKFYGRHIDIPADPNADPNSWWGVFIGRSASDVQTQMNSYYKKLIDSGWTYSPSGDYDFFIKENVILGVLYQGTNVLFNIVI